LRNDFTVEAGGSVSKTFKILFREMKMDPVAYTQLYLRKLTMYLNAYEIPANMNFSLFRENHRPLQWAFLDFGVLIPLALLGLIVCRQSNTFIRLNFLMLLVLSFSAIMFHIQGRYRIPAILKVDFSKAFRVSGQ